MSTIVKKTTTGFQFIVDGVVVKDNLKTTESHGQTYVNLPENDFNRKYVAISRFKDSDEIDLATMNARTKTAGNTVTKTKKQTWEDFLTDEEKEAIADIKKAAEARMARKTLEDQIEAQKKILEELMAKLEA